MADLNPFLLAANTPSPDPRLLPLLRSSPESAAQQDAHGYSLLHAAASYNHIDLLRTLVNEFRVDVNLRDEDGETCLFVVEDPDVAKCLMEELHIDVHVRNEDGQTAIEKFEAEQEFPDVVQYLRAQSGEPQVNGKAASGSHSVPPLPPNVSVTATTADDISSGEPDPEFRRRIEELASRDNFQTEEGQQELRDLITDAVRGASSDDRDVRRRLG